ncbi:hypothetical protein D9757_010835 [Collybiopsis confluens]|uniref:Uncharacterized protein n=1 Tax=Collybiopsis confluens TaxID=2823264 RepID=A0A8H5GLG5_9AGAR|nr:hypothetical protein D9757_010835 [Collybiopsis confluens]
MTLLSEPSSSSTAPSPPSPHRRRRRQPPPYPSSGLLALLAAVASSHSSQANASPISLDFLCPGLDGDGPCQQDEPHYHRPPESAEPDPAQAKPRNKRARLPDRYVQDTDGIWKKSGWNLYGSSMCAACSEMSASNPQVDDSVDTDTADSTVSSTAPAATSTDDFMNSLPPGWKPVRGRDNTGIILSISLSLAFFICLVMVLCIFWRRVANHSPDVEKRRHRSRKRSPQSDDTEAMLEKVKHTRTKVLQRAAARWRANARQTFRRRRVGRKAVQPNDSDDADIIPISSRTHIIGQESLPASPATSRRSSVSSVETRNTARTTPSARQSSAEERPSWPSSTPSIPPSPPAYPHHPLPRTTTNLSSKPDMNPPDSQTESRRSSLSSPLSADQSVHVTTHMAHVATDDKALLARLDHLVSAPEMSTMHYDSQYAAPVWRDEELADFAHLYQSDPSEASASSDDDRGRPNTGVTMFPPPPVHFPFNEKGKETVSYFGYTHHSDRPYPYEFEQGILDVEPEVGPSAPPFETAADLSAASPSAPPLEAEPASAPPFSTDDFCFDIYEETAIRQLHNQNALQKEDFAASSENMGYMCPDTEEESGSVHLEDDRDPGGISISS